MVAGALAALACLGAALAAHAAAAASYYPPKQPLLPGTYARTKSLAAVLESIEERLGMLEMLTLEQKHQSRRLDEIHKKMDLLETGMSVRLEQAELSKHYLERRLHMLQTSIQDSLQLSSERVDHGLAHVENIAHNLTNTLKPYKMALDQVDETYRETLRRGLVLEGLTRDGLALVNVTRRELADGLHSLARRQREHRLKELDTVVSETGKNMFKKLSEHTDRLDGKVQAVLAAQEHFLDTCHRIQRDEPRLDTQVADLLDKLLDNVINKTAITFHKLAAIQTEIRSHDSKIARALSNRSPHPNELLVKKIESMIRNTSTINIRENELQKLTEKFVDLTNRADAALQRLDLRISDHQEPADADITSDADKLIDKLQNINEEDDDYDNYDDIEDMKQDDTRPDDIMKEDEGDELRLYEEQVNAWKMTTVRPSHRRHLHKHPYDRGPKKP